VTATVAQWVLKLGKHHRAGHALWFFLERVKDSMCCGETGINNSHPNGSLVYFRLIAKLKAFITHTVFIFQPGKINTTIQANGHGRVRVKSKSETF
jgi:hypothetical protein